MKTSLFLIALFYSLTSLCQSPTQTVRGSVFDSESQFPLLEALAAMVDDSIKAGRIPSDANSIARGAAMLAMLERLTAYRDGLASRGTGAEALANTLTRILFQTISGLTGE